MDFNKSKYIELLFYILSKSYDKPNIGKTVLCTLLYFIDFGYYERYGKLLTEETYKLSKKGIKPQHFNEVTDELIKNKQLFLRKEPYYNRTLHKYYPLIIPINRLTPKETEIADMSLNKLIDNNASSITTYIKNDPPVHIAELGDELDFKYVFSRNNEYSMRKITE